MKMEAEEIYKALGKLEKFEIEILIFQLLITEKIDFLTLNKLYVEFLETNRKTKENEKILLIDCLNQKYCPNTINPKMFDARASILVEPYTDDKFIKKYILKDVDEKEIQKQRKFLEKEIHEKRI